MHRLFVFLPLMLISLSTSAQNKPASSTPPAIVSVIEQITAKQFQPDTAFTTLSEEDVTILTDQPIANWGLAQENGDMVYYNLIVGIRSYQLLITRLPKSSYPTATLLRFTTPKSKPEPIAQGSLKSKTEKPK